MHFHIYTSDCAVKKNRQLWAMRRWTGMESQGSVSQRRLYVSILDRWCMYHTYVGWQGTHTHTFTYTLHFRSNAPFAGVTYINNHIHDMHVTYQCLGGRLFLVCRWSAGDTRRTELWLRACPSLAAKWSAVFPSLFLASKRRSGSDHGRPWRSWEDVMNWWEIELIDVLWEPQKCFEEHLGFTRLFCLLERLFIWLKTPSVFSRETVPAMLDLFIMCSQCPSVHQSGLAAPARQWMFTLMILSGGFPQQTSVCPVRVCRFWFYRYPFAQDGSLFDCSWYSKPRV